MPPKRLPRQAPLLRIRHDASYGGACDLAEGTGDGLLPRARVTRRMVTPENANVTDSSSDEDTLVLTWEEEEEMTQHTEGEDNFLLALYDPEIHPTLEHPLAEYDPRHPTLDWVLQREPERLYQLYRWHQMLAMGVPRDVARRRLMEGLRVRIANSFWVER